MNKLELQKTIELHAKWLADHQDGVRAVLSGADLQGTDLSHAVLEGATLPPGAVN